MRKFFKTLKWLLILAFIGIQFFGPEKNVSKADAPDDLSKDFPVPVEVKNILENSCADCHSNNTRYPWYTHIQPVGWWMQDHVNEGKRHLNFDIFSSYNARRQYRKFEEINEMVTEGEMPLPSYTVLHRDAILTVKQSEALLNWCEQMRASMRDKYPADSLRKK